MKILVVSPIPTHPPGAGHRERIRQVVREVDSLGHDVHLLYVTLERDSDIRGMRDCFGDRLHVFEYDAGGTPNRRAPKLHGTVLGRIIRRVLLEMGVDYSFPHGADDWYDERLDAYLGQLQEQFHFECIWLEYLFLSKGLLAFSSGVLKVLDTIDVLTDRHDHYRRHGQRPAWFSTTRRQERKALRRGDVIIAIQEDEARVFRALVPERVVVTVGHFVELCQLPFKVEQPPTLLFVASDNQVNLYGLRLFLRDAFQRIRLLHPGVRLALAGTLCRALPNELAYSKLGEFAAAEDVYAKADVVISPIPFGTGLKIKNIEALGYGKPLVTTGAGAEGLREGASIAFLVGNTPEEFAKGVTDLLADSVLRRRIAAEAYQFATAYRKKNVESLRLVLEHAARNVGAG